MVWRRVLVPNTCTLRELHGATQVAMRWEGIHLYQFCLRAARYGSWELSAASPEVTLAALQLRKGARFAYEYDLNIPWRHEVRIENRIEPEYGKAYPVCIGGSGACPPEDCGGPEAYLAGLSDMVSMAALEDLGTMAEIIGQVVLERRTALLDDEETRWRLGNMPSSAAGHASGPGAVRSRAARSTRACAKASTSTSCTSNIDRLGPAVCQQIGGDQGGIVAALLPNAGDQGVGGRIGQLVEPALQRGGGRLGVESGGADALVTEKALQVGNVHSERKQAGRHGVAQQVRVDALADAGSHGDGANDLADPLAR